MLRRNTVSYFRPMHVKRLLAWTAAISALVITAVLCYRNNEAPTSPRLRARAKVFGTGLSKTGTTSLASALTSLGYHNVHNDAHAFLPHMYSNRQAYNYRRHYGGVDSVEDLPTSFWFGEMLSVYPSALFVHTIRDPDEWYESFAAHNERVLGRSHGVQTYSINALHRLVYGSSQPNRTAWVTHYQAHYQRVVATIPKSQLLIIDVRQGNAMQRLCAFLGESGDMCAGPFPHENSGSTDDRPPNFPLKHYTVNGETSSHAYVTLVSTGTKVAHVVSSVLALIATGTANDVVVMVFSRFASTRTLRNLLNRKQVKVLMMAEADSVADENFLVYHVFGLYQYSRVLYFSAGLEFTANADRMLEGNRSFTGMSTQWAPLSSLVFAATPSWQTLVDLDDFSRADKYHFNVRNGWFGYGPIPGWRTWAFEGAGSDQGLMYDLSGYIGSNTVIHHFRFWYFFCLLGDPSAEILPEHAWSGLVDLEKRKP